MVLADHTLVFIIGEAMGLPWSRSFESKSPALAFVATVLLLLGISDLISLLQPEKIIELHWGAQAPVRLLIFFSLSFYSYSFSQSSPIFASTPYIASSWGEGLKNRVLFTWSFIEMIAWFWVYVTLREERKTLRSRIQEKDVSEEK
ncbi:hypothetical protein K3495_g2372 [Podosphaera aphanis]|nr:hypothetical protein K3495_g2372 [Podosphaera aphanis]